MLRKAPIIAALLAAVFALPALAGTTAREPPPMSFSFDGVFGRYDQAQLQRGYRVYREVCSACHSMNFLTFRNLGQPGGPFWDPHYPNPNDNPVVKAIAREYQVPDIDPDTGDPTAALAPRQTPLSGPMPMTQQRRPAMAALCHRICR